MTILTEHALANVWCEPNQDTYHTFKPHRTSSNLGASNRVQISWYRVNLPTLAPDRYHAYHIGQIDARAIGIDIEPGAWFSARELMIDHRALIDAYLTNGTIVPKDFVYVRVMEDYSVVVAILLKRVDYGKLRYTERLADQTQVVPYRIDTGDMFIRFYRNMRFSTPSWQGIGNDTINPIRVIQSSISTLSQYNQFISQVADIKNKFMGQGEGIFYRDGYVENLPAFYNAKYLAKTLCYVYDASIKSVQFHKLSGLRQFDSTLDKGKSKYIILSTSDYGTIDYLDDVDFYVCERSNAADYRGVFFNRYNADAIRMLTHNAWSLNVDYVNSLIVDHLFDPTKVEIMAVIRQGAMIRGLVHQNERIEEMYRLPRNTILSILSGSVAAIPEWHASTLEASDYCKIMGVQYSDVTTDLVVGAYGYNAMTNAIEPVITPLGDLNGNRHIMVSDVFKLSDHHGDGARTIFCYDEKRELIGYYGNRDLSSVEIIPAEFADRTDMVEMFHATIDELGDGTIYDKDVTDGNLGFWGYRCYVCPMPNGSPNYKWKDVTGGPYYDYVVVNGVPSIKWKWALLDAAGFYPAVRMNGIIHAYQAKLPDAESNYDGIIQITIGGQSEQFGSIANRPMYLAPATCDIFMDGKLLIRGIDYHLKWPTAIIVRRPQNKINLTKIFVRTYGCCDSDTMLPYMEREGGFVKGGILSVDDEFDIRNDRNVMVNVAGHLYRKDEVRFAEEEVGISVTDGLPFTVGDYITPIEPYTGHDTVEQRMRSFEIDSRVQAYLTSQLKGSQPELPTVIFERWRVFSPLLNALVHEMLFGNAFNDNTLSIRYGNVEVDHWLSAYVHLLDFDPAYLGFDEDYIVVYPHLWNDPIDLSVTQYRFLQYVIRNYLFDRVELSQSINIRSA